VIAVRKKENNEVRKKNPLLGGLKMRQHIAIALLGACILAPVSQPQAQEWPTRPVKVVVPYSAGGGTDTVARAVSHRLSEKWGQNVVVENREGAGTAVGTEAVIRSANDGYTLLFSDASSFGINPHVNQKLRFDPRTDLEPVALTVHLAPVLAIANDVPANTLAEFIAYGKANPGKLTYASPGVGTYTHIAMEYFKHEAKLDMVHVPYRGSSPAMTDLLSGRVSSYMVTYSVFDAYEKDKKLKIIATATKDRLPIRPDLPTIGDQVPGYNIDVWFGFAAPAGTPANILDKIYKDVQEIVDNEEFKKKFLEPQSYVGGRMSRADFKRKVSEDYDKWGRLVKLAGAQEK